MFSKDVQKKFSNSLKRVRSFVDRRQQHEIDAPVDEYYNTSLHIAVKKGDERKVVELLRRGADTNVTDLENASPLHMAVEYGHPHLIEHLVNYGADIEAERDDGFRPTHMLRDSLKKLECLEQLLKFGADINGRDVTGNNILHLVVKSELAEVKLFKKLLQCGANVNNIDFMEYNALHTTATRVSLNYYQTKILAEGLIAERIDVNAKDMLDETPLHKAACGDNAHLVGILLSNGARLDLVNYRNLTPFEIAIENRNVTSLFAMMKHLIINNHRGKPVDKAMIRKIQSNIDLKLWYRKLENELYSLKKTTIFECTIYDILCGEEDEVMDYVRDKDSVPALSNSVVRSSWFNREILDSWNQAKRRTRRESDEQ